MLTRFRIEVEEETVGEVVEALTKYEQALHAVECERFGLLDTLTSHVQPEIPAWPIEIAHRQFGYVALGAEVSEEVIELGEGGGFYHGRRVVRLSRIDGRVPPRPSLDARGDVVVTS